MHFAWAFLLLLTSKLELKPLFMKKTLGIFVILTFIHLTTFCQEAKVISDCTIEFDISVEDAKADPQVVKAMDGSSRIVYIRGSKSRSDLVTPAFKQTVIYDEKTDSAVILRELGATKYISYLNKAKRAEKNKKFDGIQFSNTNERKTILNYDCEKVVAKLQDGSTYNVYFTRSVVPSTREYEQQFRDLPGLVLDYEAQTEDGKTKVKYTASKITLVPVPGAKFDIPKTGYRVL